MSDQTIDEMTCEERSARLRYISEVDQLPHREVARAEFESCAIQSRWIRRTIHLFLDGVLPKRHVRVGKEALLVVR